MDWSVFNEHVSSLSSLQEVTFEFPNHTCKKRFVANSILDALPMLETTLSEGQVKFRVWGKDEVIRFG